MARQNIFNIFPGNGPYRSMIVNGSTAYPYTGVIFWIKPFVQNTQTSWITVAQGQTDSAGNFSVPVQLYAPNDQMADYAITLISDHPDQPSYSPPTIPTTQPATLIVYSATGGSGSISLKGSGTPNFRLDVHKAFTAEKLGQLFISPNGSFDDAFGNIPLIFRGAIDVTTRQTGDGYNFSAWTPSQTVIIN